MCQTKHQTCQCKSHSVIVHLEQKIGELLRLYGFKDAAKEQIRSLWTSLCIVADWEVDTSIYDRTLSLIYHQYSEHIGCTFEEFDEFMCGQLI